MTLNPSSVLAHLPKIQDIIKIYGLVAKSQLSQNFILNQNVTDKIVSMIQPKTHTPNLKNSLVIEVGPGPGMLTRSLIKAHANKILAIEKDNRFLPLLQQLTDATYGQFQVIHGDILDTSYDTILTRAINDMGYDPTTMPIHIVGNLPFNIATPLLISQLRSMAHRTDLFAPTIQCGTDMTLMFQKEVANRIVATPSTTFRSRLSIVSQVAAGVDVVLSLPRTVFVPEPNVDAGVVRFVPRMGGLPSSLGNLPTIETVTRWVFAHRRKTIRNNLLLVRNNVNAVDQVLNKTGIPPKIRPQDLSTEQICQLTLTLIEQEWISPLEFEESRVEYDRESTM